MKNFIAFILVFASLYCHGQNWTKLDIGSEFDQVYFPKVHFINDNEGLLVGLNGPILRTSDEGDTWNEVQAGAIHVLYDISFADEKIGFINGLKTEDGGVTWVPQESTLNFTFLHAIDKNHLIGNTYTGANYYQESFDGGETWDSIPIPPLPDVNLYSYNPNDYAPIDDQIGYLSLRKGSIDGTDSLRILKTENGGDLWNYISVPTPDPPPQFGFNGFKQIAFPSEDTGLLVHNGGVLKTSDGGNTFTEIIPATRPEYWDPYAIHATSTNHYLLAGLKPFITETSVSMYETMDGGLTWTEAILAPGNEYLGDITCTSNNCFAAGAAVYRKYDLNKTSIQEVIKKEVKIYPNPTTDFLHLEIKNSSIDNIEIFGANGKKYTQYSIANNLLDVSGLPNGIFFLKIEYQDQANTYRFVKK